MIPDPKRRKDERCARPGCAKPVPKITHRHRRYGGEAVAFEPFCSTECCKAYHGVTNKMGG